MSLTRVSVWTSKVPPSLFPALLPSFIFFLCFYYSDLCCAEANKEVACHISDQRYLPSFMVTCFSEDGSPYLPEDKDLHQALKLTYSFSCTKTKKQIKNNNISDFYSEPVPWINEEGNNFGIIFHSKQDDENKMNDEEETDFLSVGDYRISSKYYELRDDILRAIDTSKVINSHSSYSLILCEQVLFIILGEHFCRGEFHCQGSSRGPCISATNQTGC